MGKWIRTSKHELIITILQWVALKCKIVSTIDQPPYTPLTIYRYTVYIYVMIRWATKNKLRIFQNSKDAYGLLSLTCIYISSTPSTCSSSFSLLFVGSFQISFNQLVVVAVSCVLLLLLSLLLLFAFHTFRIRNSITVWMKAKIA